MCSNLPVASFPRSRSVNTAVCQSGPPGLGRRGDTLVPIKILPSGVTELHTPLQKLSLPILINDQPEFKSVGGLNLVFQLMPTLTCQCVLVQSDDQ